MFDPDQELFEIQAKISIGEGDGILFRNYGYVPPISSKRTIALLLDHPDYDCMSLGTAGVEDVIINESSDTATLFRDGQEEVGFVNLPIMLRSRAAEGK
jgi:hypothetical protein